MMLPPLDLKNTALTGLTGTTTMTAFSYLVSEHKGKYFKEPEILNDLIERLINTEGGRNRTRVPRICGFLLHYGTGTFFSACYHMFWKKKHRREAAAGKGLAFGLLFGLIGIGIWKTVFKLHPNPPAIDLDNFLGHLLAAHVIFGETVACTTAMIPKRHSETSAAPARAFREPELKLADVEGQVRSSGLS